MTRLQTLLAAAATLIAWPALAHDGVHISDQYARVNGGIGASGAVFLEIENHADVNERLIDASSDIADKVELHTHIASADGVMQMVHVPEGFEIPALQGLSLKRGGHHVMLMGLKKDLKDGDIIHITLVFEHAGKVEIDVPVDNARKPGAMGMMDHSKMGEHAAHSGHNMTAADTTGLSDSDAIVATMKAQFDTPENPLSVDPVTVAGTHALASWSQGDKGGRALLERRDGQWTIVLCGGQDLRMPAFLEKQGVSDAQMLSQMFNAAEDKLGAEKVGLYSSFEGVMVMAPAAN